MSTPTGKPFTAFNISDYAPRRVRERGAAEADTRKGEAADPPPKAPHERQAEGAADERQTPLAPAGAHERSGLTPEQLSETSRDLEEQQGADETGRPKSAYDDDLMRLESSLQAIRRKRDDADNSMLREGRLPAAPQLSRKSDGGNGERYIDGFRLPHSLAPSYVPPPPLREGTNHLGAVMRVTIACVLAAPIAYGVATYFAADSTPAKSARGPKLATAETHLATLPPLQSSQPPEVKQAPQAPAPQMIPQPVREPAWPSAPQGSNPPAPSRDETISMAPPTAAPPPPPPPPVAKAPVRTMDPEQIALLVKQGEEFIAAGDLVTARTVFRRAAEAGDAGAALAMGATYDPVVLAKLGVRGIAPNVEKARSWYEKARDFGSAEAPRRLQILADR
jgi:hypothetical protein